MVQVLSGEKMLARAIALAATGHEGQFDKAGRPYILHTLQVMYNLGPDADDELRCIAVLHDLLEDTEYTISDLQKMGFSQRVVNALSLLNHQAEVDYDTYIRAIGTNLDATLAKLADLRHNSDITRMKGLTEKDFERMQKYQKAFDYLDTCRIALIKTGCCH